MARANGHHDRGRSLDRNIRGARGDNRGNSRGSRGPSTRSSSNRGSGPNRGTSQGRPRSRSNSVNNRGGRTNGTQEEQKKLHRTTVAREDRNVWYQDFVDNYEGLVNFPSKKRVTRNGELTDISVNMTESLCKYISVNKKISITSLIG